MKYIYILESLDSEHFYVGITDDLRARLAKHNAGEVPHTSKYGPWRIRTYFAFDDASRCRVRALPEIGIGTRFCQEAFLIARATPLLPDHRVQPIPQRDDLVLHRHQFRH
ncbi:hypothetical protein ABH973_002484 [Bradyrhizobium ottawaense]|nr:hypothetical protein TM102_07370 [Bradyrhizobium sp. TM102]